MDELQGFMKDQVSANVLGSLRRQSILRRDIAKDDEAIREIISGGVVEAFQQYKDQLDGQRTPRQGPSSVPRDEYEEIPEPEPLDLYEGNFSSATSFRSGDDCPSLTMSSQSTDFAEFTPASKSRGQFTDLAELTAEPQPSIAPGHYLAPSWLPHPGFQECEDAGYGRFKGQEELTKPAAQVRGTSNQLGPYPPLPLQDASSLHGMAGTEPWNHGIMGLLTDEKLMNFPWDGTSIDLDNHSSSLD